LEKDKVDLSDKIIKLENEKNTLENKVNTIQGETIDKIYPVGSIYISTDLNTVDKVQEKFGGEWEVYGNGKVLRGTTEKSGETGGFENIQLLTANLPVHNHSYTPAGLVSSSFTGSSATTNSNGAHTHSVIANGKVSSEFIGISSSTTETGAHTHTVSGSAASGGAHTHAVSGSTSSSGAHKHKTFSKIIATDYATGYEVPSIVGPVDAQSYTSEAGAHTHSLNITSGSSGAHTHTVSGSTANSGNHSHSYTPSGTIKSTFTGSSANTSSNGAHTHSVTASGTVSQPTFTGTAATLTTGTPK
jgi:hypothetical protein